VSIWKVIVGYGILSGLVAVALDLTMLEQVAASMAVFISVSLLYQWVKEDWRR